MQGELASGQLFIFMEQGPQLRCHSLLFLGSRAGLTKIRRFREWIWAELVQGEQV